MWVVAMAVQDACLSFPAAKLIVQTMMLAGMGTARRWHC